MIGHTNREMSLDLSHVQRNLNAADQSLFHHKDASQNLHITLTPSKKGRVRCKSSNTSKYCRQHFDKKSVDVMLNLGNIFKQKQDTKKSKIFFLSNRSSRRNSTIKE